MRASSRTGTNAAPARSFGSWLRLPVAAVQGRWMRSTLTLAPPASGPTDGTAGTGSGPPLRVGVVGDSTAAGCGVDHHDQGFAGNLGREIAARAQRPVHWWVAGQFGATARRIRYRLLPQLPPVLDVVVLLAGGNDVLSGRHPDDWREDLGAVVEDLTTRAGQVIVAGVPPFALFPAIPATLGRHLSEQAARLDEVSRQVCAARPGVTWFGMTEIPPPEFFATDGFHPSATGYRLWAQAVAARLEP